VHCVRLDQYAFYTLLLPGVHVLDRSTSYLISSHVGQHQSAILQILCKAQQLHKHFLSHYCAASLALQIASAASAASLLQPVTAHTTPLMLGAMRLLPAGLALLGWTAATGRQQLVPKTAVAWAWIAAFALVDGAAFQVRLWW
jgi:hypothetical protein